jgi:Carboxypeptidase regulatory-like domain
VSKSVSEVIMRRVFFAVALFLLLSFQFPALAQTFRGAINGTVTDPSGASVPGANVKAIESATGVEHSSVSTSDGEFAFQDCLWALIKSWSPPAVSRTILSIT